MPHIDTILAQAGRGQDPRTGAISTPIYQTSTYAHPALGQSTGFDYSRTTNPTRRHPSRSRVSPVLLPPPGSPGSTSR